MNQQDQGSGSLTPLVIPMKRKRGQPCKEKNAIHRENMTVTPSSDHVTNFNQTVGKTDDCDEAMVGQVVTGVIEGAFGSGYLLSVRIGDNDTILRGVAFQPGPVAPITAEDYEAPQVRMIKRNEIPIPVKSQQDHIQSSVPSSGQCSKQHAEPESQIPYSENQLFPTKLCSGISLSLNNHLVSIMEPMVGLPKNDTSIYNEGIPQGISKPGHESQVASAMSQLNIGKTIKKDETLHELDASKQVREPGIDGGGATEVSEPIFEPINLVPMFLFPDEERTTGQQAVPCSNKLNEWIHDYPNEKFHEFDVSRQVKEPNADGGGATKDSEPTFEHINLVPVNLFPDEEITTGQQALPSIHKLNEWIFDDPNKTLNELNASIPVKEPSAEVGGERKDSQPAFERIKFVPGNLFPDEELTTGQQAVPFVHKLNEWIHDDPKNSIMELYQTPVSADPESMPSEWISKSVDNFVEKLASPGTDKLQDTKKKLAIDTSSKVETSNSSGRPSTDVTNLFDAGSNSSLKTSDPLILFEGEVVPAKSKFAYK